MNDSIELRSAVKSDVPALRAFEREIIRAERPFDPTLGDDPIHYYDLAGMVLSDAVHVLIACDNGSPVGCGFARIEAAKQYLRHRLQGYLGLMYVVPAHRGRGVNGRIVQSLMSWCRSRGVSELRLDVYAGNVAAIRAYEKAGFAKHLIEMRLST
jgi:GNAT superfamily N-acetyltransferase